MTSPETFRALLAANAMPHRPEFTQRAKHLCSRLNDSLYKMAQEPSLAGYRIQEHVYKTVPALTKEQPNIVTATNKLDGTIFDLEYTSKFLDELDDSVRNSAQAREIVSELASKISAASSLMPR